MDPVPAPRLAHRPKVKTGIQIRRRHRGRLVTTQTTAPLCSTLRVQYPKVVYDYRFHLLFHSSFIRVTPESNIPPPKFHSRSRELHTLKLILLERFAILLAGVRGLALVLLVKIVLSYS